jgi:hypothetical protein
MFGEVNWEPVYAMLRSNESKKKKPCTSAANGRSAQRGAVRGLGVLQLVGRGMELPQFRNGTCNFCRAKSFCIKAEQLL